MHGLAAISIVVGSMLFWWSKATRDALIGLFLVIAGVILAIAAAYPAHARDDGRFAASPLKPWFDKLASGKGLCCSFADGVTIDDPDVDYSTVAEVGGTIPHVVYRVRICAALAPGETWETCKQRDWFVVPDDAVVTEPNRFGRAVVWPYEAGGMTRIRCFMPGAGT